MSHCTTLEGPGPAEDEVDFLPHIGWQESLKGLAWVLAPPESMAPKELDCSSSLLAAGGCLLSGMGAREVLRQKPLLGLHLEFSRHRTWKNSTIH